MNCAHTRFTAACAKYGLSGATIHAASFSLRENAGFGIFSPPFGSGGSL